MDFNDYINQLGQLDKQEIEVELNNFYTFNSGLLQFFKAIDNQFQSLLNSSNLNAKQIETILLQTNHILPELNNLKFEVSMFETEKLSEYFKNDITKTIRYIKEAMVISEVDLTKQRFIKLLADNEVKYNEEQVEKEKRKLYEIEEQKRIESEKQEKSRMEEAKREQERLENIRKENEEKDRLKKEEERKRKDDEERKEKERLEKIRIEAEIKEKLRLEEERKEKERLEKIRKENEEKERLRKNDKQAIEEEIRKKIKEENKDSVTQFEVKYKIKKNHSIYKDVKYPSLIINRQEWLIEDFSSAKELIISKYNDSNWKVPSKEDWLILISNLKGAEHILFDINYLALQPKIQYLVSDIEENKATVNKFLNFVFNAKGSFDYCIVLNKDGRFEYRSFENIGIVRLVRDLI